MPIKYCKENLFIQTHPNTSVFLGANTKKVRFFQNKKKSLVGCYAHQWDNFCGVSLLLFLANDFFLSVSTFNSWEKMLAVCQSVTN